MNVDEIVNCEIENFISTELLELKKEKFIKEYHIGPSDKINFKIITLEDICYDIEYIRGSGYKVIRFSESQEIFSKKDKIYENFECLLKDISKTYEETFMKSLFKKLENLKQEHENK